MRVRCSEMNVRFHKSDGWSIQNLSQFVARGLIESHTDYFIVRGQLDIPRIIPILISVQDWSGRFINKDRWETYLGAFYKT